MSWSVRTQTGWGLRGILLGAFVFLLYRSVSRAGSWSGVTESAEFWPLLIAGLLLAAVFLVFTVMTVTVNEDSLEVSMGLELIRKRLMVSDITSVSEIRIPWHSVGIKKISGGWLFSVAVSDGVDMEMKNGKRYIVGSEDPAGLLQALRSRMAGAE